MSTNTQHTNQHEQRKKPVLLFVIPQFVVGGAEMLVYQYAVYFANMYDVHVASTVAGGKLEELFAKHPHISLFVGSRKTMGGRGGVYRNLARYTKNIQPDIIHSHLFGGDIIASQLIRQVTNRPLWISTLHNVQFHQSWIRRFLWKRLFRHVDFVIAVSETVAAYAKDHFALRSPRLVTILNGVMLDQWLAIPDKGEATTPLQIATIGRLEVQKGHRYLLTALSYIERHLWQLHVYGEGSLQQQLQVQATALGIEKQIIWHGVSHDIPTALQDIDVVVQPSLWEGLSLVVMEMMAAGKPVIASIPAGSELIAHEKTGYLVPAANGVALSKMIDYVMTYKTEAHRVGKVARLFACDHFSFDTHIQQIARLYTDVL